MTTFRLFNPCLVNLGISLELNPVIFLSAPSTVLILVRGTGTAIGGERERERLSRDEAVAALDIIEGVVEARPCWKRFTSFLRVAWACDATVEDEAFGWWWYAGLGGGIARGGGRSSDAVFRCANRAYSVCRFGVEAAFKLMDLARRGPGAQAQPMGTTATVFSPAKSH